MMASVIERRVFMPSPEPGVGIMAATYRCGREPGMLQSLHKHISRSDTVDVSFLRWSDDNGRSWSAAREWPARFTNAAGTGRRHPRGVYFDARSGLAITLWTEGVLPGDNPLEGLQHWTLRYAVSDDGGKTSLYEAPVVREGAEFDERHPLPGVTIGRNCVMIGDLTCRPMTLRDGTILVPCQSTPVDADGNYWNPGGGFTYTDALVLMGRWGADHRLSWRVSGRICGDPERSTRGMVEPTLGELDGGRLLVVMRGSNDTRVERPGYKWFAVSEDGARTWTTPEPWCYDDGEPFFSPSACSQLIACRDGRLLWFGNLSAANPRGNGPRYPLVAAQVDRTSGRVIRETVSVIDDRAEGESDRLTLSNFYVRQDDVTGELRLHMTRFFARQPPAGPPDWTADAMMYRIGI